MAGAGWPCRAHSGAMVHPPCGRPPSAGGVRARAITTESDACATAVGGVREQAAGFGYLLQSRTTDSLALAINTVLDRYPEFAKTADAMSAHARSTFSIEAMVKKHLHLYERIAARGPARRSGSTLLDTTIRLAVRRQGQRSKLTMPSAITEPT